MSADPGFRLALDQGVPRDAALLLRQAGYDCIHVGEIGMARATDVEILAWARDHGSVVVTMDADFHTVLAVTRAVSPSVIRLRLQGLHGKATAALVDKTVACYRAELSRGCMITVKARKTTCHLLPTGGA